MDPPPARTIPAMALTGATSGAVLLPPLHVLEPESAFDAQVTVRDVLVHRRRHLHDRVVLDVDLQLAADAAVRTDRVRDGLSLFVPGASRTHVVLALEHQRSGRAYPDAVAAVDARGRVQRHGVFGRDPGVEAASCDRDREGVLCVRATGFDALVAEDAAAVVTNVELVVHLDGL